MKQPILLFLLSLHILVLTAAKPTVDKSSRLKFGGKLPFSEEAYVFEHNGKTYLADADYNMGATRLVLKVAQLNESLKCKDKLERKYERNAWCYPVGFRYLKSEGYLTFCFYICKDDNTKVYFQKIALEELAFVGEPKVVLDINSKDEMHRRDLHLNTSPSGNYVLLQADFPSVQAQYMFDEKENLVYVKRNNMQGYRIQVNDNGKAIAILDKRDIDNTGRSLVVYDLDKKDISDRYTLKAIDAVGNIDSIPFNPDANSYYRLREIPQTAFYSTRITQLSYRFELKGDLLYYVSFVSCNDNKETVNSDADLLSSGIYVSVLDISDKLKLKKEELYPFDAKTSKEILEKIYSVDRANAGLRLKEIENLGLCGGSGLPLVYMDAIRIDDKGNIAVFGSSYTNSKEDIFTRESADRGLSFLYTNRNLHYFYIHHKDGLEHKVGIASTGFSSSMFRSLTGFVERSGNKGYFAISNQYYCSLDQGNFDNAVSSYKKLTKTTTGYNVYSPSGIFYHIRSRNMDVVVRLFRITP